MSSNLPCPSCGAPIVVRSAALPYVTCPYCQTLVRREGEGGSVAGKVAALPFDVSPLQLGTSGQWRGIGFHLMGRVRWGWADGSWNEWLAECSDGQHRWLGEAMGSFLISEEKPEILALPELAGFAAGAPVRLGQRVTVGDHQFEAADIKEADCLGSEGDLPIVTSIGQRMTSIDFRSPDGAALSLQRDEGGASAWLGEYLELGGLRPVNLRAIDGWAIPAAML